MNVLGYIVWLKLLTMPDSDLSGALLQLICLRRKCLMMMERTPKRAQKESLNSSRRNGRKGTLHHWAEGLGDNALKVPMITDSGKL